MTPRETVRLVVLPSPLQRTRWEMELAAGKTVGELLRAAGVPDGLEPRCRVLVDGRKAAFAERPRAGSLVTCRIVPGEPISILSAIAAAIAAAVPGAGALAGLIASGLGIGTVGTFGVGTLAFAATHLGITLISAGLVIGATSLAINALNALVPTPSNRGPSGGPSTSPTLTGARNSFNRYQPVPRGYGRYRMVPPLAAETFTEEAGGSVFLNMLMTMGTGPVSLSDFRIGNDPITNYEGWDLVWYDGAGNYWRVNSSGASVPTTASSFTYHDTIDLTPVNAEVPVDFVQRAANADADEIWLDFQLPLGLYGRSGSGKVYPQNVDLVIQFRPVGGGAWTTADATNTRELEPWMSWLPSSVYGDVALRFYTLSLTALSVSLSVLVPSRDRYEFRIRNFLANMPSNFAVQTNWVSLRSVLHETPVVPTNLGLLSLRIRSTDQLAGVLDNVNCVAEWKLAKWDPDTGALTAPATTRNPAWVYLDLLLHGDRPVPLARIDLDRIVELAEFCEPTPGTYVHTFDAIFDYRTTKLEAAKRVLAVGRASVHVRDGRWSCVIDRPKTEVANLSTPRNSLGLKGKKTFVDPPHALRCEFRNELNGWEPDERIVYDDGYGVGNATRFETLEIFGITHPDRIWKAARYHIAVNRLRTEEWEQEFDVEWLVAERGDRVELTHDVPLIGLGYGRITATTLDGGGNLLGLELDQEVTFEPAKTYQLRVRLGSGAVVLLDLANPATSEDVVTREVDLASPLAPPNLPVIGELVQFGESGSTSEPVLVRGIAPHRELGARVVLIPYAAGVFAADGGSIPPHTPVISLTRWDEPAAPEILGFTILGETVTVRVRVAESGGARPAFMQLAYRIANPPGPWSTGEPVVPVDRFELVGLIEEQLYDVRVRTLSVSSIPSDWVAASFVYVPDGGEIPTGPSFRVTALELVDNPNDAVFSGRDVAVQWRLNAIGFDDPFTTAPPTFSGVYVVRVYATEDGALLREIQTTERSYVYPFAANAADAIALGRGPQRAVTIGVRYVDDVLGETVETRLAVSNTVPGFVSAFLQEGAGGFRVYFTPTPDTDFEGLVVYASTTSGFTPSAGNEVGTGASSPFFVSSSGGLWYVRVAAYDAFARDANSVIDPALLNVSPEEAIDIGGTVDTVDISPDAVTERISSYTEGYIVIGGSWVEIQAVTATIPEPPVGEADYPVLISGRFYLFNGAIFRVKRDGTTVYQPSAPQRPGSSPPVYCWNDELVIFSWYDTAVVPGVEYEWTLEAVGVLGSPFAQERLLTVETQKR